MPNVDSDANCALYCINEEGAYSKLAPRVRDGTLCEIGTNNMCVGGFCKVMVTAVETAFHVVQVFQVLFSESWLRLGF